MMTRGRRTGFRSLNLIFFIFGGDIDHCKPAVMAETEQYVAFGSEYRALVNLPSIGNARGWEPEPATVYFWKH